MSLQILNLPGRETSVVWKSTCSPSSYVGVGLIGLISEGFLLEEIPAFMDGINAFSIATI